MSVPAPAPASKPIGGQPERKIRLTTEEIDLLIEKYDNDLSGDLSDGKNVIA